MDDQQNLDSLDENPGEIEEGEVPEQGESPRKRYWPMIVVGVAMLLMGVVLGYLGRGVYGPEAMASKATAEAVAVAIQTRAATNKEVMTMLIGATRHFKGDANAPVTIIEFSDFQ
jgi:hypothetical protein